MDSDVDGLVDLRRAIKTPISGGESVHQGLRAYPRFLSSGAVDSLRAVGDWMGGISAMRKTSALCEACNVPFEPPTGLYLRLVGWHSPGSSVQP